MKTGFSALRVAASEDANEMNRIHAKASFATVQTEATSDGSWKYKLR
jgi:hypothetical protein